MNSSVQVFTATVHLGGDNYFIYGFRNATLRDAFQKKHSSVVVFTGRDTIDLHKDALLALYNAGGDLLP